jgi:hypothetical protein
MIKRKSLALLLLSVIFSVSCSSVTDKSSDLLTELLDALKPVYLKAKKLADKNKLTREKKAEYIKKFNDTFEKSINKNLEKYVSLMKKFRKLGDKEKMSASIEYNNYYYDASVEYAEEDEEESNIAASISFFDLLNQHRSLVSIDAELHDELKKQITLKKFEAIVLREVLQSYTGGNFNSYITRTIDNILTRMLMAKLDQYKKREAKRLKKMKSFMSPGKFEQVIEKRAIKTIERTKGLMWVFLKRYIKKDLEKKLGENFNRMPAARIKAACSELIQESEKFVNEKTPIYEKEKQSLNAYRKVYRKEYVKFENLVNRWKKLNPIFTYANTKRSIDR